MMAARLDHVLPEGTRINIVATQLGLSDEQAVEAMTDPNRIALVRGQMVEIARLLYHTPCKGAC